MAWSKTSSTARGYGTKWRRLRERVLKRDGYLCQCSGCKAAGRYLEANEVDHVVSKAEWLRRHGTLVGVDDMANLQAINVDCHKLKTTLEKGFTPILGCDTSGIPRDPNHPWNLAKWRNDR